MINVLPNHEIPTLRSKYAWVYETLKTKWKYTLGGGAITKIPVGQLKSEIHIKRINFIGIDKKWHKMEEVMDFGRTWWRLKKPLGYDKILPIEFVFSRIAQGIKVYLPSYYGRIKNPLAAEMPLLVNVDATYYPDPNIESTSVDGYVKRGGTNLTWNDIVTGAGTYSSDADASVYVIYITSGSTSGNWNGNHRGIFLFDASGSSGNTITDAVLSLYGAGWKQDNLSCTPNVDIYTSTPATDTAIVDADYAQVASTSQTGSPITYANWSSTAYNAFTLDATGVATVQTAIDGTGIVKLGARNQNYDVLNSAPNWVSSTVSGFSCYLADQANTTSDPKLELVYSVTYGHADFQAATSTSGF